MANAIGDIIKRLRLKAGFDSLGDLSRVSDVTVATLSRIESGNQSPSPKTLKKLAPLLNVDHKDLMIAAGYLSSDDPNPDADLQPTPPDRVKIFQKKLGELSPESLDFLEFQLNRLHELDLEVIERKKAERAKQRDKNK